jgi:hypothetical protein
MRIPNDNGVDYRLKKFIEYQHAVPPVHQKILVEYAESNKLSNDSMVLIAWLMSNTYHELTSLLIFEEIKYNNAFSANFKDWWHKNQHRLIFGSAKKYIKMNDRILGIIEFFQKTYGYTPYTFLSNALSKETDAKRRYELVKVINLTCKNHGRFSEDLFLEILMLFQKNNGLDLNIQADEKFDWEHCANLTSAVFNLMYKDNLAEKFDKGEMTKQELQEWNEDLVEFVKMIEEAIEKTYKQKVDIPLFITKLCSFRNLFKNARYGGYHHDRQLEYIIEYSRTWPEKRALWKTIIDMRYKKFSHHLLGELNGWRGIRKERKKLWTTKGLTGVEAV